MTVELLRGQTKRGRLEWDSSVCSGCRTCEAVCSLYHEGAVCPELSRIQITTREHRGWRSEIHTCRQCYHAECLGACQWGALYIDERTGARVIDAKRCTGCQDCFNACPSTPSGIRYDPVKFQCIKCDVCGGDPQCVKFCMEGALTYREGM